MSGVLTVTPRRITDELLAGVTGTFRAVVVATNPGLVAGLDLLDPGAAPAPVGTWRTLCVDGDEVPAGRPIVEITGTAAELGAAEDFVLGPLGFAGGVAARARAVRRAAPAGLGISCGGWKKLPAAMKPLLRAGLEVAGIRPRLVDGDFVYVPKNTVTLLGGLETAVRAGLRLDHGPVAAQVTDVAGALIAVRAGARIVMVDNGDLHTLAGVDAALRGEGLRPAVTVGFGGGVTAEALAAARTAGADVVDVGRAILDAPLWDLRVEVSR
jgi:nicotinate-nucleotide pyrophosphorylase (carboxylating)